MYQTGSRYVFYELAKERNAGDVSDLLDLGLPLIHTSNDNISSLGGLIRA